MLFNLCWENTGGKVLLGFQYEPGAKKKIKNKKNNCGIINGSGPLQAE